MWDALVNGPQQTVDADPADELLLEVGAHAGLLMHPYLDHAVGARA